MQFLLQDIQRSSLLCTLYFVTLYLRFGQGTLVHFLVLVERYRIDLHRHRRHHIRRFLIHDEGIECLDIDLLIADDIGCNELTATRVIEGLHRCIFDTLELANDGFHLFELDTETADLDLSVLAADELDLAVKTIAYDIACPINAFTIPVDESLSGLLRLVEITDTYLRSGDEQFARCTPRHTVTVLIDDEQLRRIVRVTDRDVGFILIHPITAHIDRCLRRTVTVLQDIGRRVERHQFFTTCAHKLQAGDIGEILHQLRSYLRRHEGMRDAFFEEIVMNGLEVKTDIVADDVHRRSGGHTSP